MLTGMADISVQPANEHTFRVTVEESGGSTTHEVTVEPGDVERLAAGTTPTELVEASFRFLLDREPKESILARFELSVIARYFPEYESRIGEYL